MNKEIQESLIKFIILKVLKSTGYESINSNALETFTDFFIGRMDKILSNLIGKVNHAKRNYLNLFDLLKQPHFQETITFIKNQPPSTVESTFNDNSLEFEQYKDVEPWISPLENKKERIIHIYDWMPELPPIYTYRRSELKESLGRSEAIKVKTKVDQSLKSEKNLFKLFKTSNSIPPFINYLHQTKK